MPQSDFGTIVASTKTGAALATDLNNWRDALYSGHRGSTAPSYAVQGLTWLDDSGGVTSVLVKRYDGADWITEGGIDETANTYTPYFQGTAIGSMSLASSNVLDKSGAYTAVAADRGKLIDCSSGTWALTLTAPGTLGDGWYCGVRNSGSGLITVTPAGGNINGASTITLNAGDSCLVFCNGTGFFTLGIRPASVDGPGGSTDNTIPRFDGTGGRTLQDSGVIIDDDDNLFGHGAGINAQTGTTYTLTASDNGKVVTLNNGNAITLTVPQTSTETLAAGFQCVIVQRGAGQVTVAKEGSDIIESKDSNLKLTGQHSVGTVVKLAAGSPNTWGLYGDLAA